VHCYNDSTINIIVAITITILLWALSVGKHVTFFMYGIISVIDGCVSVTILCYLMLHSGRIVNVTSVKGLFVSPFIAAYAMTKFAVEAFSDALRIEMKKFGVTVSVVEPGHFGGATESLNVRDIHDHD